MQPFIFAAVIQLCLVLANSDNLAAASDKNENLPYPPEELRVALVVRKDAIRTLEQDKFPKNSDTFTYAFNAEGGARSLQDPIKLNQYFLLHDWKGKITDEWVNDTTQAILLHRNSLVLLWNWAGDAALDYSDAVEAAQEKVGKSVGKYIVDQYNKKRLDLDKLTLIGQGIGAHIVGIAGKTVDSALGKKAFRIIGVSPAGPDFHFGSDSTRLHKNDAKCVAAVHTDQLIFGYKQNIGGLDFVANEGYHQPGCRQGFGLCSHRRAIKYLIEAIRLKVPYNAEYYDAPKDFSRDDTWRFLRMVNGNCSMEHRPYHFATNSQPPYLRFR